MKKTSQQEPTRCGTNGYNHWNFRELMLREDEVLNAQPARFSEINLKNPVKFAEKLLVNSSSDTPDPLLAFLWRQLTDDEKVQLGKGVGGDLTNSNLAEHWGKLLKTVDANNPLHDLFNKEALFFRMARVEDQIGFAKKLLANSNPETQSPALQTQLPQEAKEYLKEWLTNAEESLKDITNLLVKLLNQVTAENPSCYRLNITKHFLPTTCLDEQIGFAEKMLGMSGSLPTFLESLLSEDAKKHLEAWSNKAQADLHRANFFRKRRKTKDDLGDALSKFLKLVGELPRAPNEPGGTDSSELIRENRLFLEEVLSNELCYPLISTPGPAEEPWVPFTTEDRIGLALSGGGVRSATFNLGLLQALADNKVLERLDYLSTVSGGGYIGSFWTRWRKERTQKNDGLWFPKATGAACEDETTTKATEAPHGPKEIREPKEIRHLREFSRFLIPRKGLNREFWSVASTFLSGLVPSLVAALATVFLTMTIWTMLAHCPIWKNWIRPETISILLIWVIVIVSELRWRAKPRDSGSAKPATIIAIGSSFLALGLGLFIWMCRNHFNNEPPSITEHPSPLGFPIVGQVCFANLNLYIGFFVALISKTEPRYGGPNYQFDWSLFGPCMVIIIALAILILLLTIAKRIPCLKSHVWNKNIAASLDRVMGCLLAFLVFWAVLAGIWELARWLVVQSITTPGLMRSTTDRITGLGSVTAVFGLLFHWVQNWLMKPKDEGGNLNQLAKFARLVKPRVPQLLANVFVVLLFLVTAVFLVGDNPWNRDNVPWASMSWSIGFWLVVLLFVLWIFNPGGVGLHEFYRARLSRCYLGASNYSLLTHNRDWAEHPGDDMDLKDASSRPIHLICCAANQFWGDPLGTLHRGARSVVLSRFGITLGDFWRTDDTLRLSSALTASGAAINSLMGDLNVTLNRAVPFVMTTLNLRLGLWVKNPASEKRLDHFFRRLPGLFVIREMLGLADCRTEMNPGAYMHLSDGGHFENLGVYELIRRHCRYIIVSDAGNDKNYAFNDLGRATRRVREDFGVEIDIDLTPLRPDANGFTKQHVAVGVIHYDGVVGNDKGTIVYLKPTLTGNEPIDLLQYQKLKPAFPHESTLNQFFDEAQFESYRRLGEHTVYDSFRPLEVDMQTAGCFVPQAHFKKLRLHWQRVPWMHTDVGVRLCKHASELEDAFHDQASPPVRKEFISDLLASETKNQPPETPTTPATDSTQTANDLMLTIRALTFVEEAWVICELDHYWSNPRAQSWMSYLQRWAAMPTLRKWWPALKSFYGTDFVNFANAQLNLSSCDVSAPGNPVPHAELNLNEYSNTQRDDDYAWRRLFECWPHFKHHEKQGDEEPWTLFDLRLTLPAGNATKELCVQVGLAAVKIDNNNGVARWHIDDGLFVPPELYGGGFTTSLLEKLIETLGKGKWAIKKLHVDINDFGNSHPPASVTRLSRGQAGRQEQVELIDFYRNAGFKFDGKTWNNNGQNSRMYLDLPSK